MADYRAYINRTMSPMLGGKAAVAGLGQQWTVSYTGTVPAAGSQITLYITNGETAEQFKAGAGDTTRIVPTFCYTYNNKMYILAGSTAYMSEVDDPESFNKIDGLGNGFIAMSNQASASEDLVAMCPFQGRLAFFTANSIYIWSTNADIQQWQLLQTLKNIGAVGKLSVQPKGDLDIMFLSHNGVRSMLARESSLNAFVDDVGAPIDSLIQAQLLTTPASAALANAVVDPTTGRYWLWLVDTLYVHSYFPSSKVSAWSTYRCLDNSAASFVPKKMFVYNGQVHIWTGNSVVRYGGSDKNTYDGTVALFTLPKLDLKNPGRAKMAKSIHAFYSGHWRVKAVMGSEVEASALSNWVWDKNHHTAEEGIIPFQGRGQHFQVHVETDASHVTAATFSSLILNYEGGPEV